MCSTGHTLTDIQALSAMEREWLHIVRLQCMSYEHDQAQGLDRALSHAETQYGADQGPEIASRIAVLIRAMRTERWGGFGYLSPFCPNCQRNVTDDEWQLIALMRAGYRGGRPDIDQAAADFARRAEAPVLAAAATRFGSAFAATQAPRRSLAAPGATLH